MVVVEDVPAEAHADVARRVCLQPRPVATDEAHDACDLHARLGPAHGSLGPRRHMRRDTPEAPTTSSAVTVYSPFTILMGCAPKVKR